MPDTLTLAQHYDALTLLQRLALIAEFSEAPKTRVACAEAAALIEAQRAEIAQLRTALQPFAAYADQCVDAAMEPPQWRIPDDRKFHLPAFKEPMPPLTVGDCRRAADALRAS